MKQVFNRREFLRKAAIGAGALTSGLTPVRAVAEAPETVRIGYLPITDATPLLIAHALGYFEDEGLKVEKPVRIRDWSSLSESFLTGKFNLVHLLLPIPIWMRYHLKFPARIMAWDHTNGSAITIRSDTDIKTFADLGGKQVAVPYWYSMHNIILQLGLRKVGLTPVIRPQSASLKPNEVNLFVLPPPEMPVALSARKIDGFIVAEPFNAFAELKIDARIMRFTGDIWKNHPCCVVVMDERLTNAKPIFTQKVMNAVVRAQLWVMNHRDETAKLLSLEGKRYLPAPEAVLKRVFTGYDNLGIYNGKNGPTAIRHPEWDARRIDFQPYPYPSATKFILSEMLRTKMEGDAAFLKALKPDEVVRDLVSYTHVKQAIVSVGGPGKFEVLDYETPSWDREEILSL